MKTAETTAGGGPGGGSGGQRGRPWERPAGAAAFALVSRARLARRYKKKLASKLFQDGLHERRILDFGSKQAQSPEDPPLRTLYNANREAAMQPRKYTRHIPQSPERILDAPDLLDDYYLNLLDWNSNNILGEPPPLPTPPARPPPLPARPPTPPPV